MEKNDIMISLDKACEILECMLDYHDCGDYDIVATPYDTIEEFINSFRETFEKKKKWQALIKLMLIKNN